MRRRKNRWWIKTIDNVPEEKILRLKSQDGPIGETWLSQEFVRILEEEGEKGRLTRARSCARKGSGTNLKQKYGFLSIGICCSGYTIRDVSFRINDFKPEEWDRIIAIISADAALSGAILAGDFGEYFIKSLEKENYFLLPKKLKDLYAYCNCGDSQYPCIHVAVAWYLIAEVFDSNPWLLMTIRGMEKETIISRIKTSRSHVPKLMQVAPDIRPKAKNRGNEVIIPDTVSPKDFFSMPKNIGSLTLMQHNDLELNPVSLLGPAPFSLGGKNLANRIIDIYPMIEEFASSFERKDTNKK